jgi:endonuclease IV
MANSNVPVYTNQFSVLISGSAVGENEAILQFCHAYTHVDGKTHESTPEVEDIISLVMSRSGLEALRDVINDSLEDTLGDSEDTDEDDEADGPDATDGVFKNH